MQIIKKKTKKKGFKGKKNVDLWQRFLKIYPVQKVKFVWVKGHNGHPLNERVDQLAVEAAEGTGLFPDVGYELSEEKRMS